MAALFAVVALGLMAYLPGRPLVRWLLPGSAPGCGRLLLELLAGNAAAGLVGLALAEAGVFSLPAAMAAIAAIALLARRLAGPPGEGYAAVDAGGALLALAALAWVLPAFDTTLYGHDSSVYTGGGVQLARHGRLDYADPSIEAMPAEARRDLFPSYGRTPGEPPFVRLAGGLLMQDLDEPVILPAFHHLFSVWVALAWSVAGDGAIGAATAYFAALAAWAVVAFAHRLGGLGAAAPTFLLLVLSAPQLWYSRFAMPEVPSQYFLWAGLVAAGESWQRPGRRAGVVAGLGLGLAGLMRLDGLLHLWAALALWWALAGMSPAGPGFLLAFGGASAWAIVHQILFPTHYRAEVLVVIRFLFPQLHERLHAAGAGLAALAMPRAMSLPVARGLGRLAALLAFVVYAGVTAASTRPDLATTADWLLAYVGWPILAAAPVGLWLWLRRSPAAPQRFALLLGIVVLAQLLYDPRVTPAPLWAIRRFLPVVLPMLLIAGGLTVAALWERQRLLAAALVLLLAFGPRSGTAIAYRAPAFEDGLAHVRTLAALLPDDAVVVVDPTFGIESQIHIALWSVHGTPTYLLHGEPLEPIERLGALVAPRPVYWLGPEASGPSAIANHAEAVATYRFGIGHRHLHWYDRRDDLGVRDITAILYRVRPGPAAPLH